MPEPVQISVNHDNGRVCGRDLGEKEEEIVISTRSKIGGLELRFESTFAPISDKQSHSSTLKPVQEAQDEEED